MEGVARAGRCVLGLAVGFVLSDWLFRLDPSRFMPLNWTFAQVDAATGIALALAGAALGGLTGQVLTRGERLPAWPVGAYVAGVLAFVWTAVGEIQGVVVGEPMGLRWLWWALVALTPALGALLALGYLKMRPTATSTDATPRLGHATTAPR